MPLGKMSALQTIEVANRNSGRTQRMLLAIVAAICHGQDVHMVSTDDGVKRLMEMLPGGDLRGPQDWHCWHWPKEKDWGTLRLYRSLDERFDPSRGTWAGQSGQTFVDHYLLCRHYGWVLDAWLQQNRIGGKL